MSVNLYPNEWIKKNKGNVAEKKLNNNVFVCVLRILFPTEKPSLNISVGVKVLI